MMIVKLTILALVITAVWTFIIRTWSVSNPKKVLLSEYPNWMSYGTLFLVFADIIGILASVIWLLFFR